MTSPADMFLELVEEYIAEATASLEASGTEVTEESVMGWLVGKLAVLEGKL